MTSPILSTANVPASWRLVAGNLGDRSEFIHPDEMAHCAVRRDGVTIVAEWSGHPLGGAEFHVRAVYSPSEDGLTACEFSYSGWESELFVEDIHFPVIDFDGAGMEFYNTYNLGSASRDIPEPAETQPFMHMQFFAASDGKTGVYCECRDKRHFSKSRLLERLPDGRCRFRAIFHMPCGEAPYRDFTLPYPCRFGALRGSWFEATQIYRKWACAQSWFASRTQENPLRKIGIWVWNRGPSETVVPPVLALAKALPEVPVALDWYWWHHNPYDTDYPGFWPPREGVEKFREAVALLKRHGVFVQTYLNGALWDSDNSSWENGGADEVILLRNGEPKRIAFNRYNRHRLGFICGENHRFAARLTDEIQQLRNSGLDGQYLDVIGCIDRFLCCNPAHRHPRNGGTYAVDGYREMMHNLIAEFPGYPFSTEYCNESFMDLMDGMIACGSTSAEHFGETRGTPLPLFSAVYHGRNAAALFGNYAHPDGIMPWDPLWPPEDRWQNEKPWHELYPDQFFLEVVRGVIWGLQPMVCNLGSHIFSEPQFESIRDFIVKTARFYHANRDFLFDGTMESPDGFSCEEREVEFFARMIFTRESECRVIRKRLPALIHTVWRSPEGQRALFLGNYTGEPQSWRFGSCSGTVPPRTCIATRLRETAESFDIAKNNEKEADGMNG